MSAKRNDQSTAQHDKLPIRMLHDRVLVKQETGEGERRSGGGHLIPATAAVGRPLAMAEVVPVGENVRTVGPGDPGVYNPAAVSYSHPRTHRSVHDVRYLSRL